MLVKRGPQSELGYNCTGVYLGWSDYTDAVSDIEDPKYLASFVDAFPRMRMITTFGASSNLTTENPSCKTTRRWIRRVKAYRPDVYILYGATNTAYTISSYPEYSYFLPSAFNIYRDFLIGDIKWAMANDIDAYCFINEVLISATHSTQGMIPTSITRSSNIATATFSYPHGLTTGDYIFVSSGSDASYRVDDSESGETAATATVVDATTITYPSTGSDGTASGSYKINWSAYEAVRKLKSIATILKSVAPTMPLVMSESQGHTTPWINLGIGTDIDFYGHNGYGTSGVEATTTGYSTWKSEVDTLKAAFGNKLIITEHNAVLDSAPLGPIDARTCEQKGFENTHSIEVRRRIDYLVSIGISQIYYFSSMQGQILYNTYPNKNFGDNYFVGGFRPVYNDLRREPRNRIFLGTGKFDGSPYWG